MSRVQISTVLAIDTATPAVTAGIVRRHDLVVLGERVTVDARAHAERLTPNVLAALADAALTMADLDAVVVGCGPGPFTGLRAGMASAAAYGHALGIPVYGVCSLDAIAGKPSVTRWWSPMHAGVRSTGHATATGFVRSDQPLMPRPTSIPARHWRSPVRRSTRRCSRSPALSPAARRRRVW
ncbi:ribosomal-protein-alanine acetyltransferase rimI [Mycobacterium tuberculosis]|nr:ribosomal-protein-alanine acetyltransferase rimI [Mycobacterium tuberculosis]